MIRRVIVVSSIHTDMSVCFVGWLLAGDKMEQKRQKVRWVFSCLLAGNKMEEKSEK